MKFKWQKGVLLLSLCSVLYFTACIGNPFLNKRTPAQHKENISPAITEQTFEEADLNKDGVLDKNETAIATKIEQSRESKWSPHLIAFIAIVLSVLGVTVVCMVISGFRGKPREGEDDSNNPGFGNFFGLVKDKEEDDPDEVEGGDFMGDGIEVRTEVSGLSGK